MKTRRWTDTAAFRADPAAAPAGRPSRRQTLALLVVLIVVAGAVAAASYVVRPDRARAFDLVHGSVFLEDSYAPVGIDLASGKPTVRITNAAKQVGATTTSQLSVVPLDGATLLLNNGSGSANSGEFNEVDDTGFVVKTEGAGVPLSRRTDRTTSVGYGAVGGTNAPASAYIVRTGPNGTDVFLVSEVTVTQASVGTAKPRAGISLPAVTATRAGSGASANGGLWVLVRSGARLAVHELSVPPNSRDGAELKDVTHGTVDAVSAIGVARDTGTQTANAVGVAQPTTITIYRPGEKTPITVATQARDVDEILPAANQTDDRLTYLLHTAGGWRMVSVRSDGSGVRRTALSGVPADARLAQPARSGNSLVTIDRLGGQVYEISPDDAATATVRPYPRLTGEAASLSDAYVVASGPRAIVNSPGHSEALVLFTDGSRGPLVVRKSSAVEISASANASTFTKPDVDQTNQGTKPKGTSAAAPKSQPVSTRVDCKTVNEKPHIPAVTGATPGSRSVVLTWTYPLLDRQDCVPSTYQVSVDVLSNDAPKPDGSVTVQGQQSVNLTGLYPSTRYRITVAAYLNKQHTTSRAVTVTTGPEGPAAPTGVSATADAAGNWKVSWSGCGTVAQGCVPATSWRVIPSFCDGVGLSAAPNPLNVPADPTTKAQAPALYKGSDDLLGRGLRFQIEGTGAAGQTGTPSKQSACVYSYSPPNAGAMSLKASVAGNTEVGGTTTANVTLSLGANPTRDVGGYGAKIALTLSGNGNEQTRSFTFNGNQTLISTNFAGVGAGAKYTANATVTPAHGGSAVTIGPKDVTTRANWPAISLDDFSCPRSSSDTACTLSVRVRGISSAAANGERFKFNGLLDCANANRPLSVDSFDPAAGPITFAGVDQSGGFYGSCTVSGTLVEATNRTFEYFGGSLSGTASLSVNLGAPIGLSASSGNFNAAWEGNSSTVRVTYTGTNDAALRLTTDWTATVIAPGGHECGSQNQPFFGSGIDVTADDRCVQAYGAAGQWTVDLRYTNHIDGSSGKVDGVGVPGQPPEYKQPCVVDKSQFGAAWNDTRLAGISVTYGGSASGLTNCSGFKYTLLDKTGAPVCNGPSLNNDPPPQTLLYITCGTDPATGWQVQIGWTDTLGNDDSTTVTIPGDPPTT